LRDDVVIAHSGSIFGFAAHMAHWPAHDLTVAALANCNPFAIEQLAYGLARRALGQPDAAPAAIEVSPDKLAMAAGRFVFANTEVLDLTVAEAGLTTIFPRPGGLFRPFGQDRFFLADDPEISFEFADATRETVILQDYRSPLVGMRTEFD
jgi:hypothetical protein